MSDSTVLITGGTGFIGQALTKALLEKGYSVIVLTRNKNHQPQTTNHKLQYAEWDVQKGTIDLSVIRSADHIIHLAGAGVADKRWTPERKQEIVDSRVKSGELLFKALLDNGNKIKTVISASGIGWYGPDTEKTRTGEGFVESDPVCNDFLGATCKAWEAAIRPVESLGKRLVIFRTGVVVGPGGGVFREFKKPLRFGVASFLGSGEQVMSWVHRDDVVRAYMAAIRDVSYSGIYNLVSPQPVTNKTMVLTIAKTVKGKFYIPVYVPAFLLKLVIGEMSIEVLKSARVSAKKIHDAGFTFLYPGIEPAIRQVAGRKTHPD